MDDNRIVDIRERVKLAASFTDAPAESETFLAALLAHRQIGSALGELTDLLAALDESEAKLAAAREWLVGAGINPDDGGWLEQAALGGGGKDE